MQRLGSQTAVSLAVSLPPDLLYLACHDLQPLVQQANLLDSGGRLSIQGCIKDALFHRSERARSVVEACPGPVQLKHGFEGR